MLGTPPLGLGLLFRARVNDFERFVTDVERFVADLSGSLRIVSGSLGLLTRWRRFLCGSLRSLGGLEFRSTRHFEPSNTVPSAPDGSPDGPRVSRTAHE